MGRVQLVCDSVVEHLLAQCLEVCRASVYLMVMIVEGEKMGMLKSDVEV